MSLQTMPKDEVGRVAVSRVISTVSDLWGDFPAPTVAQHKALRAFLAELDAGRTDSEPVCRWLDAGAPFAYLLRALSLARAGHRDEAARDLDRAVDLAPDSVLVRTVGARIRFVLRDYASALADLDAAAELSASGPARAAALDWKFELTRRLGGYREALEAISRARACDEGNRTRNIQRFEQAAQLLYSNNDYEGSLRHIGAALAIDPSLIGLRMRAAAMYSRLRDLEGARRAISAAIELSSQGADEVTVRLDGARHSIELAAFADARDHLGRVLELEPGNLQAIALLGQLSLWAGDTQEATRLAGEMVAAGLAAGWRLRGALRVLTGDHVPGIADLDEALRREPGDHEAHVWRGEALFRTGRLDEAFAALNRGGELSEEYMDYLAPQILRLLVQAARNEFPGLPDQGVPEALDRMFGAEREAIGRGDVTSLCGLLERAIQWMRGNRSFSATYVRPDDPAGELVPLRVRPSPRTAAKLALWLLRTEGVERAHAAMERVHEEYPRAPEPHCYHGELYLFVGDYAAARSQFERALALYDKTRWAFIGLGALELLEGRPAQSLPLFERSVELSRGAGPTLFVYRGEAHRRLGNPTAAIADLEYATQLNPTRVSAWIDLALARDDDGDRGSLDLGLERLRQTAPGLVHDAARAAGIAVCAAADGGPLPGRESLRELFETTLRLMRGNRSSTCVTYFTGEGRLRVVPPVPEIDSGLEQRELRLVRSLLERSLGLAGNWKRHPSFT